MIFKSFVIEHHQTRENALWSGQLLYELQIVLDVGVAHVGLIELPSLCNEPVVEIHKGVHRGDGCRVGFPVTDERGDVRDLGLFEYRFHALLDQNLLVGVRQDVDVADGGRQFLFGFLCFRSYNLLGEGCDLVLDEYRIRHLGFLGLLLLRRDGRGVIIVVLLDLCHIVAHNVHIHFLRSCHSITSVYLVLHTEFVEKPYDPAVTHLSLASPEFDVARIDILLLALRFEVVVDDGVYLSEHLASDELGVPEFRMNVEQYLRESSDFQIRVLRVRGEYHQRHMLNRLARRVVLLYRYNVHLIPPPFDIHAVHRVLDRLDRQTHHILNLFQRIALYLHRVDALLVLGQVESIL